MDQTAGTIKNLPDATILLERESGKDNLYQELLWRMHEAGLKQDRHPRLIRRFQIKGVSPQEAAVAAYQSFAVLGLDQMTDPLELFDGQLYVYQAADPESVPEAISAAQLLRLAFPYRKIRVHYSLILLFDAALTKTQCKQLDQLLKKQLFWLPSNMRRFQFPAELLPQTADFSISSLNDLERKAAAYFERHKKAKIYNFAETPTDGALLVLISASGTLYGQKIFDSYLESQIKRLLADPSVAGLHGAAVYGGDLAFLPALLTLPAGICTNLDILRRKIAMVGLEQFLWRKNKQHLLLLLKNNRRDDLFSALEHYDLTAQVIGKTEQTRDLKLIFQGRVIAHMDQNSFAVHRINQKITHETVPGEKSKRSHSAENKETAFSLTNTKLLLLRYPQAKNTLKAVNFAKSYFKLRNVQLLEAGLTIAHHEKYENAQKEFVRLLKETEILLLPDGSSLPERFISTDQLLADFLETDPVKNAVNDFLRRGGRILAVGNGFSGLLACGLLPYGRYRNWGDAQAACYTIGNSRRIELPPELRRFCVNHRLFIETAVEFSSAPAEIVLPALSMDSESNKAMTSPDRQIFGFP